MKGLVRFHFCTRKGFQQALVSLGPASEFFKDIRMGEEGGVLESLFGKKSQWNTLPVFNLQCQNLCNVLYSHRTY